MSAGFDVSVVIPLYNKAPFIGAALDSVAAQTLPPREVIVVDDGSTDGGRAIVEAHRAAVRIVDGARGGPGEARNLGIAAATGDWVALLDADDWWDADHLATLAALATRFPEAAAVSSRVRIEGTERADRADRPAIIDFFAQSLDAIAVHSSSVAIRREALARIGPFDAQWPGEDVDYWARLALAAPIAATDRSTAVYRQGTGGLMEQHHARPNGFSGRPPRVIERIDQALPTAAPALARSMRRYRARTFANIIRQALLRGDRADALGQWRAARARGDLAGHWLGLLVHLPRPLLRAALAVRSRVKP